MKNYTAKAAMAIAAGTIVGLSKEQAAARAHALTAVDAKAGIYRVTQQIQFKAGEVFATDGDLNKGLADSLEPEETTRAKAKDKKRADADAKDLQALKEKAAKWDEVQEELGALRLFVQEIEALPKALHDQVKAEIEKARAAGAKK